jgi:hypothetical protein
MWTSDGDLTRIFMITRIRVNISPLFQKMILDKHTLRSPVGVVFGVLMVTALVFALFRSTPAPYFADKVDQPPISQSVRGQSLPPSPASRNPEHFTSLASRWNRLSEQYSGIDLDKAKLALCEEAVTTLTCSPEILKFLDLLVQSGDNYYARWLKNDGMKSLFLNDNKGEEARLQLISLPDLNLKQRWSYYAGLGLSAAQAKTYPTLVVDDGCRQNVLSGYWAALAKTEPTAALNKLTTFLKTNGQVKGLTAGGLTYLIENIPMSANFQELAKALSVEQFVGETFQAGRGCLIQRWAQVNPNEAMQYIIENPKAIEPECLARVFNAWTDADPDLAVAQAQDLSNLEFRELALESVASKLTDKFPDEAWQLALQIKEPKIKRPLLQRIFNTWSNIDEAGANAALDALKAEAR